MNKKKNSKKEKIWFDYKVTILLIVITKINDFYLSVQLILEVHAVGQK